MEKIKCPKCGNKEGQLKKGFNRSGTQRYICKFCKKSHTPNPKIREIPEETKELAIKMYYGGISALGVAKILKFAKGNVLNWIKKKPKSSK
jgi:transposase-like protein